MHCETSFDSGTQISLPHDFASAIDLEDVGANDKVLIKTMNSEYRFAVIDPLTHTGMLSGGSFGDEPRKACLIESLGRDENGALKEFRGLKTGARALFYLSSGRRIERVTTSNISSLTLVKAADRTSLIS